MTKKASILNKESNDILVHEVLTWYLASKRRGTHSTKTRAEVRGGGKKPWKQKGTGRARAGSIRSPLWRTGGVIFGPIPRSYGYSLPIKKRKLALAIALSDKNRDEKLKIAAGLLLPSPKTKEAVKQLNELGVSGKTLVILQKENEIFSKAARNIKGVTISDVNNLNIFDILNAEWVVLEKTALANLEEKLA
ncbi:MAG: 50S ribosomal protein L4 [bacterium]